MRADVSLDLLPVLALQQPHRGFFQQIVEADAVDEIDRVDRVALRLRHLLALGVAHDGVDVDVAERHLAGEVPGHHHHARHPEEDDVVARHQHRGGQEHFQVLGLFRPAERGEGHQGRGEPRIEDVRIAPQGFLPCHLQSCFFAARDKNPSLLVVPRRDLVAPPELARDAPVLDVLQPLVVSRGPVLRDELHLAARHRLQPGLRQAFHLHEPLVGEHRLDDRAGAARARDAQLVGLFRNQEFFFFQVAEDLLAGLEAF